MVLQLGHNRPWKLLTLLTPSALSGLTQAAIVYTGPGDHIPKSTYPSLVPSNKDPQVNGGPTWNIIIQ